ncbi:MAG: tetratricopeptide repeat protein [Candidatus Binataceae bacterium]
MATTHHKLRRKDLKQPDEFQTFFDEAGRFLAEHLAKVVIGAVAAIVIGVIAFGVYFYEAHQNRLAGEEFYQALSALDHKDYKTAEQRFKALAANRPGHKLGRLAELYVGDTYMADDKPTPARDAFKGYLANDPQPPFKGMALNQLGVAYEDLGDFKQAHQAYSEAAALPGGQKTQAALASARMLVKMGDSKSAIAAYRQFLTDNPFARERQDVMEAMAELGVSPLPPQTSTSDALTKPAAPTASSGTASAKHQAATPVKK